MSHFDFAFRRRPMMRGSAKLLILKVVESRPMHGYEVGKEISRIFDDLYDPSPGIIYPTLQWLTDAGHLSSSSRDGRTVYSITKKGREFLKENQENLSRIISFAEGKMDQEGRPIMRSAMRLGATVRAYAPEMTAEDRAQVAGILDEARERISRVMAGGSHRRHQ
jgi:DNA-binding PadR family transcriptional regulator